MVSGIQREVLALYRACLREAGKKPVQSQPNFRRFARRQFEKHLELGKKDFSTIEYLLRRGRRQLDIYASPGVKNVV